MSLRYFRQFSFPLGVYAYAIALTSGETPCLHYGVFDGEDEHLETGQARAAEMLWSLLPPPCRLLYAGAGQGSSQLRLSQEKFSAVGITPDPAQVSFVLDHFGKNLSVICSRFEDFEADQIFDAIVLQESGQYINAVDLFAQAGHLLGSNGSLIIVDEFRFDNGRHKERFSAGLHFLDDFVSLADRQGFSLSKQIAADQRVIPTLDHAMGMITSRFEQLSLDLGLDRNTLERLLSDLSSYKSAYELGIYGYRFLRFDRRPSATRVNIRWVGEGDVKQVQSLFRDCFAKELSLEHWRWKYRSGRAIGVWKDDQLVAHYGGLARQVKPPSGRFGDGDILASQSVDVMTHPSARSSLTRKGALFAAAASYLEQEVGYGRRCLVGYGFPNKRAFRLPRKLGLYGGPVEEMLELEFKVAKPVLPNLLHRLCPLTVLSDPLAFAIDACWQRMSQSLENNAVLVRDAEYIRHRYLAHPGFAYEVLGVYGRLPHRLLAVLVLNRRSDTCYELTDWIAPQNDIGLVIAQANRAAAARAATSLTLWGSGPVVSAIKTALRNTLDSSRIKTAPLDIQIPSNQWTCGPSDADLQGSWWLTAGDTDFR